MSAPMMKCFVVYIFLLVSVVLCFDDEFEGSRTLNLEHSFDQGVDPLFTKRGTVIIKSVQSKRATFSQISPLSTDERTLLQTTAREDGIYRIRIPIRESADGTVYVSTFTKACAIYESSLSESLIISVDQSGEVLAVSMATAGYCNGMDVPSANLTDWNTKVEISVSVTGPVPDTQSYIDKIKKDEKEKSQGGEADNRSFFSKYWMYIVPFVIMMFIMQSMDTQGGGGGR